MKAKYQQNDNQIKVNVVLYGAMDNIVSQFRRFLTKHIDPVGLWEMQGVGPRYPGSTQCPLLEVWNPSCFLSSEGCKFGSGDCPPFDKEYF